jgi:hypothetical protein
MIEEPARGPAADEGVRPTIDADGRNWENYVALAAFPCGSVRNPIRVMSMEHDNAGEALARLRELTAGYTPPDDACNTFRAFYAELADLERDLHLHIHLGEQTSCSRAPWSWKGPQASSDALGLAARDGL